ncbi:YesL family protein [Neobacillus sp. GCM10023253]|uniref:YesL family protein n=1 Tax=Neobacillus sp. GCM10023253 TaxID=3252644 RepID=UPI003621FDD7
MQLGSFSNGIYVVCNWIARLAYLNLLWILFTLSGFVIFGFFPATIAMLATLRQYLLKNHPPVFQTFWQYYKKEFHNSNKLGLIFVAFGSILYVNITFLQSASNETAAFLLYSSIIMSCIYFLLICYTLASYVEFDQPLRTHIKNALLITIYSPIPSLFMIFGTAAIYFAVATISGLGFFFSVSLLGLVILSSASLAFKRITRKQEEMSNET